MKAHHNGTARDDLILGVITLLCEFYRYLGAEGQFLSEGAKDMLPKIGRKLAQLYGDLANHAFSMEERLWKLSPKLHLAEHLLEVQAIMFGNTAWYWCYADEDLVGLMIDVAEGCDVRTLAFSVLFKWLHTAFND